MATKKVYFGSVGPFLFDDISPINDVDGDFVGEDHNALVTDGQLLVEGAPTNSNNVIRYQDLISMLTPTFVDVTVGRLLNTVYQNGDYLTFAQISLRLRENPFPTTPAPTTLAPTTILTTLAPTTILTTLAPTTPAPTTLAPTTVPLEGARANFLEGPTNPPIIITGIVAKALGGSGWFGGGNPYIEVVLSTIIPPNHFFMLEEDQPYVEILRWIEYRMGV